MRSLKRSNEIVMRHFLCAILLITAFIGEAQTSAEEVKKHHIYKIIEKFFEGKSLEEKTVSYFDRHGNIFKETSGNVTEITTCQYEYENERLKKVINYDFSGKEEHTTEYFYNPDGSYMTITTEKNFGAKNYFWFKANGDVVKAFGGDTLFYKYNELGKLEEIKTDSNGEVRFYTKFSYNPKGQLVKVESPKDEFNNTAENYQYNSKGKLIKATTRYVLHGLTSTSVSTYTYNKKGFLVKEITIDTNEGGKSTTTKNIYEYEVYEN